MTEQQRREILSSVTQRFKNDQISIDHKVEELHDFVSNIKKGLKTWFRGSEDQDVVDRAVIKANEDIQDLNEMRGSPYFFMAEVIFQNDSKPKQIYISRSSFYEQGIYSWVAPIARMRFAEPGNTGYQLPSGEFRQVEVIRKDKYIIRDGDIFQINYETKDIPNTTILDRNWQEKQNFGLTDIIEKLDAYQDDIIRIPPRGSFLISGPAGSGKTTLALHKMAYLTQSPETAEHYRAKDMLIFVQDVSTMAYFASILPALGLGTAKITTFTQWAMDLLGLNSKSKNFITYVNQIDHPEYSSLLYAKNRALKSRDTFFYPADIFTQLESTYFDFFDEKSFSAYKFQKENRMIDRFDLTLLLQHKIKDVPLKAHKKLILVDEAENYLSEQLNIIKKYISTDTDAMIYIGDLEQRTFPFTINSWQEAGERFSQSRHIKIPKVYRITKQIRDYLVSKGYDQDLTLQLRGGPDVQEFDTLNMEKISKDIQDHIKTGKPGITGIICNDNKLLAGLKELIPASKDVHLLNIYEAQGVEFDTVFLIFKTENKYDPNWPEELIKELQKVNRDLFMVGATRAKNKLIVYTQKK